MLFKVLLLCVAAIGLSDARAAYKKTTLETIADHVVNICNEPGYIEQKWGKNLLGSRKYKGIYASLCMMDEIHVLYQNGHINMALILERLPAQMRQIALGCRIQQSLSGPHPGRDFSICLIKSLIDAEREGISKRVVILMKAFSLSESDVLQMLKNKRM